MAFINSLFRFITAHLFTDHATRAPIARKGHIALSFGVGAIYVLVFGVKPLLAWLRYKFFDGVHPEPSWGTAVAAAVLIAAAHLFTKPEARETAGIAFLRFVH